MRWSFIFSSTDSMSSRLRLLEPTRPFSIPNMPPKAPPFLELKITERIKALTGPTAARRQLEVHSAAYRPGASSTPPKPPVCSELAVRRVSFLEASPRSLRCFLMQRDACSTESCQAVQNSHCRALLTTPDFLQED
ncbi:Toll/interleukin-1 receptor domain-containing adapter protein [Liparis tanakae]|uniref:Toll/interleukin-1 receptor domain-containing adapter protein n=1 Tax=Liparis tanakae TaxID=230148 RepID=A0A4Z2IAJ8_9TELE|nr:Toll/interleukin-1 receptor domain-containing adapter protein [Liparis tanakae]